MAEDLCCRFLKGVYKMNTRIFYYIYVRSLKRVNSQGMSENWQLNKLSLTTKLTNRELEHKLIQANTDSRILLIPHLSFIPISIQKSYYSFNEVQFTRTILITGTYLHAYSLSYLKNMVRPEYVLGYVLVLSFSKFPKIKEPPLLRLYFIVAHTLFYHPSKVKFYWICKLLL